MSQVTATIDSTNIVTLNSRPIAQLTAGEGKAGELHIQDDYINITTAMLAAGQAWRMCRIPTTAKIKRITVATDGILDSSSTQTLALDFNIAFSDSTLDFTQVALQGQIPTTANNGAVTPIGTYTSPNKLFGTITLSGNNAQFPPKINGAFQSLDITFNGQIIYNSLLVPETPLYELFGFVNSQGYPADPGGMFDILVNVSVAAAAAAAANMYMRVEYVR